MHEYSQVQTYPGLLHFAEYYGFFLKQIEGSWQPYLCQRLQLAEGSDDG